MVNLLIHAEQYDVVGILPSQLESIRLLAHSLDVERLAYVDGTVDGIARTPGWERYGTIKSWLDQVNEPIIAFTPEESLDIRKLEVPDGAWLAFGPSMGWTSDSFGDKEVIWSYIPVAVLNSRDAVPIALWETHKWPVQ
jgi:hypothetical protein